MLTIAIIMMPHYETILDNGLCSFLSSPYAGFIKLFY